MFASEKKVEGGKGANTHSTAPFSRLYIFPLNSLWRRGQYFNGNVTGRKIVLLYKNSCSSSFALTRLILHNSRMGGINFKESGNTVQLVCDILCIKAGKKN